MRVALLVMLLCARAAADPAAIRKALDDERQRLHIAGLAYAVVVDDKIVALEGLGVRDVAHALPVTPDTVFPIGSCTKAFTAMGIAIASDEGKLTFDDSPRQYLPWFKLRDAEANELVTIRDMLSHRSGLKAYADLAALPGALTREQYLRAAIVDATPTAKLRATFQYSNAMVTAAGEILGHVNKTSWDHAIEQKVLAPLEMKATRTSAYKLTGDAALGYAWDGQTWKPTPVTPSLQVMAPAGSIASTARDMARWVRMLAAGGVLDGKRFVSEAALRELTTPQIAINATMSYGLGWAIYEWNGHRVVEHNGGSEGLSAIVSFMPDKHVGFVILANSSPTALTKIGELGGKLWPLIVGEKTTTAVPAAPPHAPPGPAAPELSTKDLPTVDAVLARMVQAAGGERNLRKHTSLRLHARGAYDNEGVSFELTVLARAGTPGDARVEDERWTAAGVRIGRIRSYFDGTKGAQQTTFGQDETFADVAKARRDAALHPLLDLQALYGTVAIAGRTQLDGEDAFVLTLGADTKLYVSARTGLVLRRDHGAESTRFFDYRSNDGELVATRWTLTDALGDKTVRVDKVEWNVALPDTTFAPAADIKPAP